MWASYVARFGRINYITHPLFGGTWLCGLDRNESFVGPDVNVTVSGNGRSSYAEKGSMAAKSTFPPLMHDLCHARNSSRIIRESHSIGATVTEITEIVLCK